MKVKIPVYIIATASMCIGEIEVEKFEECEDAAYKLFENSEDGFDVNCHNNFDLGDTEIDEIRQLEFDYYKKDQQK